MKRFICAIIFASSLIFLVTSCSKSSDPDPAPTTPVIPVVNSTTADHLTGGSSRKWRQTEQKRNGTAQPQDSCDLDNRITFTKTGSAVSVDVGAVKCDATEESLSGTWVLSNNDKNLTLNLIYFGIPFAQDFAIVTISADSLVTKYESAGDEYLDTYRHD